VPELPSSLVLAVVAAVTGDAALTESVLPEQIVHSLGGGSGIAGIA
jgi:hypothetical protein